MKSRVYLDTRNRPRYSINPVSDPDDGRWEWHCHACDIAKEATADRVIEDACIHHDLWHTDGPGR